MAVQENARYRHVHAVVRIDDFSEAAAVEDRISIVSCFLSSDEADTEAERLTALNSSHDCRYVVIVTRLKGSEQLAE